jgi:hypothetical protein
MPILLSRIALFGPHANAETFDRDERDILRQLARSAALAYTTLQAEEVERLRVQNRKLQARLKDIPDGAIGNEERSNSTDG